METYPLTLSSLKEAFQNDFEGKLPENITATDQLTLKLQTVFLGTYGHTCLLEAFC